MTPIFKKKGSKVGVAVGYQRTLREEHGTPVYDREDGLLIFFFNDNDEVEDIKFFSFSKLETRQGRIKEWRKIRNILRYRHIDFRDFHDVLQGLKEYCGEQQGNWFWVGGGNAVGATVSGGAALIAESAVLGGLSIIFGGVAALFIGGEAYKWDTWEDIIDDLQYIVSKEL